MKPTVLIVSNVFWTISRFRHDVVRRLAERGVAVHCIAAFDGTEHDLAELGARVSDLPLQRKSLQPLGEWKLARALWRLIDPLRNERVLLYTVKPIVWGGLVCRLRRAPYVCLFTGLGTALGGAGLVARIVRALAAASTRGARLVVCLNAHDARFVESLVGAVPGRAPPPIMVLPGEGVDPSAYAPDAVTRPDDPSSVTFLFCSRILLEKGIDTFVLAAREAGRQRPDLRFRIAGWLDEDNPSGLSRRALDALIDGAPIDYLGRLDDPREAIAACDVVVLPTRYAEGVPRILLEGACMQKGLIASSVPGCTDVVIDNETGWLVRPGDAPALTAAFLAFASLAPDERDRMGRRAREHVTARYSNDAVWLHYVRIFEAIDLPLAG